MIEDAIATVTYLKALSARELFILYPESARVQVFNPEGLNIWLT
jgi:hypothetical protein